MGVSYQLTDQLIRFLTTGDVEFAEGTQVLREALQTVSERSTIPNQWDLMFDIQESKENRSSEELREIAHLISTHRHLLTGRCALIVADPLHFGLARMFGVFMENLRLEARVFTDMGEAQSWLSSRSEEK